MSVHLPGFRPTGWNTAGDHETRIRGLEATKGGGVSGVIAQWNGNLPIATGTGPVRQVPYDADGSSLTFLLDQAFFRIETPQLVPIQVTIQSSPGGNSVFTPTTVATLTIPAASYEPASYPAISSSVVSGDLLRIVYVAVGTPTVFEVQIWGGVV